MDQLTERQLQVLLGVYQRLSIRENAKQIGMSPAAVQRALYVLETKALVSNPRLLDGRLLARGRTVTEAGIHELRRAKLIPGRGITPQQALAYMSLRQ